MVITSRKYIYYLKSSGTYIIVLGSCWLFYQLRETCKTIRSSMATNVLKLEQSQASFIYLDDPRFKDIFTFSKEKHLHKVVSQKKTTLSDVIFNWWKSLNRSLAFRLMNIAKNGTRDEKIKAIYSLGSLKHLKPWHYGQLAQMMDAQTAVALARIPDSDLQFFLNPPNFCHDKKLYEIIDETHQLLININRISNNQHSCVSQFLKRNLQEGFEVDLEVKPTFSWNQKLLMSCIETIYHHSSFDQFSKDIADAGGFKVLMNIQKMFSNNIDICILIAKIISNISLHAEYLEDIFRSGWIGVLANWSRNNDIRLAAPAARALFNLDNDTNNGEKFPKRIYLLHPMHRTQMSPKVDVVFIHGLLGGIFISWRQRDLDPVIKSVEFHREQFVPDSISNIINEHSQEFLKDLSLDLQKKEWEELGHDYEVVLDDFPISMNSTAASTTKVTGPFTLPGHEILRNTEENQLSRTECWPKDWLPKDLPSARVIGINYDTNLSLWKAPCPLESTRRTISERSEEFTRKLLAAGLGKRPVVWVCHSMGGLLVKQMLVEQWKRGDPTGICKNTKGIIFYSTPHRGSHVAALKQATQMLLWPSVEVQELREECPKLLKLHDNFLTMLKTYQMDIISFSENKSTLISTLRVPFQFVTAKSANPGVGEFYEIPQDHLCICKPANRYSFLYQKVLHVLQKHIQS